MKEILIVDDQRDDLCTMKTILETKGFKVTDISDSRNALKLIKENGFDLVLIDVLMPFMRGDQLAKRIRSEVKKDISLAYVSVLQKEDLDLKPVNGFIQKPFTIDGFVSSVKKIMAKT